MGALQSIVILAILVAVAWFVLSPNFVFRIRISDGSLRLTRGTVRRDFVEQLSAICREWNIQRGWIGGVRRGQRLTLIFSRSVPPGCRQQIRNLWTNG
jgi:hypothetical protein